MAKSEASSSEEAEATPFRWNSKQGDDFADVDANAEEPPALLDWTISVMEGFLEELVLEAPAVLRLLSEMAPSDLAVAAFLQRTDGAISPGEKIE